MGIKNVMLIINPCAGRKSGKKNADKVISMLKKHGLECTLFMTQRRGDATQFVIDDGNKYDIVVCMGGDGTLNEVINGVLKAHLSIPLGYIPAGSTNDFARSMHLSKNLEKSARIIAECNVQDIDAGLFNDRYFGYVSSFGLFTRTSYSTPQKVKNVLGGKPSYLLHGLTELGKVRAEHMKVETNGKTYEADLINSVATKILPASDLNIGKNILNVDYNDLSNRKSPTIPTSNLTVRTSLPSTPSPDPTGHSTENSLTQPAAVR